MRALTFCDPKITSTRTAAGQFKGQFKGAMERYTCVRFAGKLTDCHTHTHIHGNSQHTSGAMDECSRNVQTVPPNGAIEEMSLTVQNASAHIGAHIGASTAPSGLLGASTFVIALPAEDK